MENISLVSVEKYVEQFDLDIQKKLIELRQAIMEAAPNATEKIAWTMPTYYQNGYLVQFAAYKKHIGFYSSPGAIEHFKDELGGYKTNKKNTIQFPLDKELPVQLVKKIVQYRIREKIKV